MAITPAEQARLMLDALDHVCYEYDRRPEVVAALRRVMDETPPSVLALLYATVTYKYDANQI